MSEGLEELKKIELKWQYGVFTFIPNFETIEKELKSLVTLKDILQLKVYKNKLGQCFLEGINILMAISNETYDLLKEVLL